MGCDVEDVKAGNLDTVSIHAPAWGATLIVTIILFIRFVSIHAPAWGATFRYSPDKGEMQSFNPRTRVGCDIINDIKRIKSAMFQSTHPRGVRRDIRTMSFGFYPVSIHAPAWGATYGLDREPPAQSGFQSTHPRGVRHQSLQKMSQPTSFNPRTRVGCGEIAARYG